METNRIQSMQELLCDEMILYKFLSIMKGNAKLQPPSRLTKDIEIGIQYVFSGLTDQEFFTLYFLYAENLSNECTCELLGISSAQLSRLMTSGKRKLHAKWGLIQYGVEGWLKKREKDSYNTGYIQGHKAGYQQGKEDAESLDPPQFISDKLLSLPIEGLHISTHARLCLLRYNYKRIGDIVSLNDLEIRRIRGLGKTTASEIAHALNNAGVKHTEWDQFLL